MKDENTGWDGISSPPPEVWDAVLLATSGVPVPGVGNIANAIIGVGLSGIDAPDPQGTARLVQPSGDVTLPLEKVNNDVHAIWSNVVFEGIALGPDTSIEVTLYDTDVLDDDNIGSLSIPFTALVDAWLKGGGYWHESSQPRVDHIVGVKFAVIRQ